MGQINPNPCTACDGIGAVRKSTTLQVQIPSGVSEGEAVSIRGEGNRIGGSVGDVLISFSIDRSDSFLRKKNDIYVNVTVPLHLALLGGIVIVPTIDGNVELKVAPGTQPDDVKRMTGRGIYNASTREQGNQYVKFKVEIPKTLTKEQQELLAQCFNPTRTMSMDNPPTTSTNKDQPPEQTPQWLDRLWRWLKGY